MFFLLFCLMIEGSGSESLTNGSRCGSVRPKNIWIRNIAPLIEFFLPMNGSFPADELVAVGAGVLHALVHALHVDLQ